MQILRTTNHVEWLRTKSGKCKTRLILVENVRLATKVKLSQLSRALKLLSSTWIAEFYSSSLGVLEQCILVL